MDDRSFEFEGISIYGEPISAEQLFHNGLIRPVNHYQQHRPHNILPLSSITRTPDENGFSKGIVQESKGCNDHFIFSPPAKQVQKQSNISKPACVRCDEKEIIEKSMRGRKTVNGYTTDTRRVPMSGCNCTKAHENKRKSFLPCRGFLGCSHASGTVENCQVVSVTKPKGSPPSMAR